MTEQAEEYKEQVEEEEEEPEEEVFKKPRKKMSFTPEQLEKKKQSMNRAREAQRALIEKGKAVKKAEEAPKVIEKPIKPKKQVIREIIKEVEESESEEEEVIERVIIKKVPRHNKKVRNDYNDNDLVNLTYREKLQQQLKDEKYKYMMSSLFDF